MKYALLIYDNPGTYSSMAEDEYKSVHAEYMALTQAPGVYGGEQLQPIETATTVRVNGTGEALTTDGPFVETKEVFAGFYLVEAGNLDEAIEIAAKIPASRLGGAVEVRPLVENQP